MSDMNRRDFLKIAGAGSAVLAAIGAGVVATGKVFRADPASTGPKDPLAAKRWRRENPCGRPAWGIESSDGDALAALGATRADDGAAARGLHARTKAVGLLAMDRRGLESALHGKGL